MTDSLQVEWVRSQFPALQRNYQGMPAVYFDGPGGSQVVQACIDAMSNYMAQGGANLHGVFPSSHETEATIAQARQMLAAFLQVKPQEIAFGPNMTTLTFAISRALARTWQAGDEIIVTEMDHRANVDPWLLAAADAGVTVKWLPVNPQTLTLETDRLTDLLSKRTRLVAVGVANNAVGTITDVATIAQAAHAVGATVVVDAVHAAPHVLIDRDRLGADILLCSAYKFFGPHVGIAAIRASLLENLAVYKLQPAPNVIPDRLETGTQNHEGIAGIVGAMQFLATLGKPEAADALAVDDLRGRFETAMARIDAHEQPLAEQLRRGLGVIPNIRVFSATDDVAKTPTVAFQVTGMHPRVVCEQLLARAGVFVADGHFYASTLAERVGVIADGGWVRAGLAPYNTAAEVNRMLEAVASLHS